MKKFWALTVLRHSIFLLVAAIFTVSCATTTTQDVRKAIQEDPSIVFEAIAKDPQKFSEVMQKASLEARKQMQEQKEKEEQARIEQELKNPLTPKIASDRASFGDQNSPYQLVVYSDFQCPYCKKGAAIVEELKAAYKGKLFFTFKHLPLDFHPFAMPAAKRFEAIALQSAEKAFRFHDAVFKDQGRLKEGGEKFLDEAAKKSGANMAQMKKDMESVKVRDRIADDMREASGFGIQGTPAFIAAGVSLRGAYPIESFRAIFEKRAVAAQPK